MVASTDGVVLFLDLFFLPSPLGLAESVMGSAAVDDEDANNEKTKLRRGEMCAFTSPLRRNPRVILIP